MDYISDENVKSLAQHLIDINRNIILIFAFNGTGKTRLSVEYKNVTKEENDGSHSGVYYNAYSEDLFVWNNDAENMGSGCASASWTEVTTYVSRSAAAAARKMTQDCGSLSFNAFQIPQAINGPAIAMLNAFAPSVVNPPCAKRIA